MIELGETNCHDCHYATKINTGTYRCRRKKYDIEKKTCFVPRKEDADGDERRRPMSNEKRLWIIEARDGAWGANGICKGELVRCKDCLYHTDAYPYDEEDELIPSNAVFCQHFEVIRDKDWFCADGKRKDGERDERTD